MICATKIVIFVECMCIIRSLWLKKNAHQWYRFKQESYASMSLYSLSLKYITMVHQKFLILIIKEILEFNFLNSFSVWFILAFLLYNYFCIFENNFICILHHINKLRGDWPPRPQILFFSYKKRATTATALLKHDNKLPVSQMPKQASRSVGLFVYGAHFTLNTFVLNHIYNRERDWYKLPGLPGTSYQRIMSDEITVSISHSLICCWWFLRSLMSRVERFACVGVWNGISFLFLRLILRNIIID